MLNNVLIVSAAIIGIVIGWIGFTFNRFDRQRNMMREAWSGIDVQLKRRHDLIPRLVECVKGYKGYEGAVLENLVRVRTQAQTVTGIPATSQAESTVTLALRSVLGLVEAYPDLKAGHNFQDLSAALIETEDQLQFARRYYNGTVRDFSILAESFPSQLVARLFGFHPDGYFEAESSMERQVPKVKL